MKRAGRSERGQVGSGRAKAVESRGVVTSETSLAACAVGAEADRDRHEHQ